MDTFALSLEQLVEVTQEALDEHYNVKTDTTRVRADVIATMERIKFLSEDTLTPAGIVIRAHGAVNPVATVIEALIEDIGAEVYSIEFEDSVILFQYGNVIEDVPENSLEEGVSEMLAGAFNGVSGVNH